MNRIQIAASALAATVSFASMACAADMAVKAPPMAPVPATSWTGYYVGVNAGGTWGGSDINVASVPTFAISPFINFFPIPTSIAAANAASGNLSGRAGFIGGAQIGYNQQFSDRFVAGIETDFQGTAKAKSTRTNSTDAGIGLPGNNVTATIAANKIRIILARYAVAWAFSRSPLCCSTQQAAWLMAEGPAPAYPGRTTALI